MRQEVQCPPVFSGVMNKECDVDNLQLLPSFGYVCCSLLDGVPVKRSHFSACKVDALKSSDPTRTSV